VLTALGAWCLSQGIDLDVEKVLHPDTIERYCALGLTRTTEQSIGTVKSMLRRLGPVLTVKAPWQPQPQVHRRLELPAPYSVKELAIIHRDIRRQGTETRRLTGLAFESLGLGVGLDGRWAPKVRGTDVSLEGGFVLVRVNAPSPRVVVVRSQYAKTVLELSERAGDGLLTGRSGARPTNVAEVAGDLSIDQGRIHLSLRRLRSTWRVAQLDAGTNLEVVRVAAGVENIAAFKDICAHMKPVATKQARDQLRSA